MRVLWYVPSGALIWVAVTILIEGPVVRDLDSAFVWLLTALCLWVSGLLSWLSTSDRWLLASKGSQLWSALWWNVSAGIACVAFWKWSGALLSLAVSAAAVNAIAAIRELRTTRNKLDLD